MAELALGPTLDADKIKEGDDVYFECNIDAKPAIYRTSWWFNVRYFSNYYLNNTSLAAPEVQEME